MLEVEVSAVDETEGAIAQIMKLREKNAYYMKNISSPGRAQNIYITKVISVSNITLYWRRECSGSGVLRIPLVAVIDEGSDTQRFFYYGGDLCLMKIRQQAILLPIGAIEYLKHKDDGAR